MGMSNFCKIFEIPEGQILVTLLPGGDDAPVITFTHVVCSKLVCVTKTGVTDNDWDLAQKRFDKCNVEMAIRALDEALNIAKRLEIEK